ncbi:MULTISPECIES: DUF937 domain-containing protein [Okeania]|uniref:DUF937 domain-containing protein n=1 Tax=Okeania hirsuta TaxID=1458930 RepID=A0A3N6PCF6_9CYAN|nr:MULTISPECIES: DUF937 domain-containing protein [Okeania]NET17603.1 DUF937 domain-containing protein [Okeania sp. SIO1H6]NES78828.1 DUF937 domain-containing protein [Okeania sp. SIO1H4]NES91521.1 DUF937 domain-containing protein [Okeania sp. SIO2B9]NET22338.1 DUF937 domain-containing protein [Okeania sp. SIO1H5]NET78944.1 DUF937 domain-containing protein [Okeania sp. SIO1F9]
MGLFDQIVGAINNPNQEASTSQLSSILGTVQQLSGNLGGDSGATQVAMSMLGGYVRSALQQKREESGNGAVQAIINQFAGTDPNPQAVESLFSANQITGIVQSISEKTGFDLSQIQNLLPTLVPLILNLLKTGNDTQNPNQASNNVLNSFLDADGDGDVDISDMMGMASRFLK